MCEEGTVHLVGGDDVSRGRVLYCFEGTWYSLCDTGWEDGGEEARVVCTDLGYNANSGKVVIPSYFLFCMMVFPPLESVVANFGHGSSPILPFRIQCGLDDTTLSECATTAINTSDCPHVAGVICQGLYIHLIMKKISKLLFLTFDSSMY